MHSKITWPGLSNKNTVVLPLDIKVVPFSRKPLLMYDETFMPKEELHITLIGKKVGSLLKQIIDKNPGIEQQLKERFESIDWSFQQSGPIHLLSRTKESLNESGKPCSMIQKSIILLLEMRGMDEFYEFMRSLNIFDGEISTPPPHITLYTHNCPNGIGIPSRQILSRYTGRVMQKEKLLSHDSQPD